jgi:hypothetical protein
MPGSVLQLRLCQGRQSAHSALSIRDVCSPNNDTHACKYTFVGKEEAYVHVNHKEDEEVHVHVHEVEDEDVHVHVHEEEDEDVHVHVHEEEDEDVHVSGGGKGVFVYTGGGEDTCSCT